jgi:hypothetical protein
MANRPKINKLDDRDYKALELFKSGESNVSEVARQCGFETSLLHHLINGNVEKAGNRAIVFQREYAKLVDAEISKNQKAVSRLSSNCEKIAYGIYERELGRLAKKAKLDPDEQKLVNNMSKAMAALKPSAPKSLKLSQTWNYTKGLTPQELAHEFSRLSGLAEGPPDTGAIRESESRG